MSGPRPRSLKLKRQHRVILKQLIHRRKPPRGLAQRAQIILLADQGWDNSAIAAHLGIDRNTVGRWTVGRWRPHWQTHSPRLLAALAAGTQKRVQQQMIEVLLSDAPRPGTPVGFTVEQRVQIIALACEDPQDSKRPVSHWTLRELAAEIVKRGIAETISERTVQRILNEADLKPHRVQYGLNQTPDDPQAFWKTAERICLCYRHAPMLYGAGIHVVSSDEMTGIQALERLHPTLPLRPGQPERQEFEYERHGTRALIASLEVALGSLITPANRSNSHRDGFCRSHPQRYPNSTQRFLDFYRRPTQYP